MAMAMNDLIKLYTSFINTFDGSSCDVFESAEPLMDKLFDPSLVFITGDGPRDLRNGISRLLRILLQSKVTWLKLHILYQLKLASK